MTDSNPLSSVIYEELHRIAHRHMAAQRRNHSLQPTALLHEAYLKLAGTEGDAGLSKPHFLRLASRVMRQVLVDHARRREASKRGGGLERAHLSGVGVGSDEDLDVLELHEALEELTDLNPEYAQLIELRFFGGLTESEVAEELGVSRATLTRRWRFARAWLMQRLAEGQSPPP